MQDHIFLRLLEQCPKCEEMLDYNTIMQGMQKADFICIYWEAELLPNIEVTIGALTSVSQYGVGVVNIEKPSLMSEKELRIAVSGLYEEVQNQKKDKMFDIMLFREVRSQIFWNWIFYFIKYDLPYDWIIPYDSALNFMVAAPYPYICVNNPDEDAEESAKEESAYEES